MARLTFLGLNAVRFLSIVALLLVFSSSIVVMVTNVKAVNRFQAGRIANSTDDMLDCDYIEGSTVPNQPAGVFWAIVATLLIIFQVIILLLSELSWPAVFFDRFFPVLGSDFGLGALGVFQCLIGAQILSHHVDDFTLVSAFFLFSIGCLNILLGLIFRESAKSKRSLRAKKPDAGAGGLPQFVNVTPAPISQPTTNVVFPEKADNASVASFRSGEKAGYGFGRQGEKAAGLRGFLIQRPEESLPRYASPTPTYAAEPPALAPAPTSRQGSPAPSRSTHSHSHRSGKSRRHNHHHRRPASPARSDSSGSDSDRSSTYTSSSFASPMSYRETIQIPDSPLPPRDGKDRAVSPSKYGRNPGAF